MIEVLTWDGTRFEPFDLVANNILASGTVAAKHLAVDSVTAEKVKANAITVDKLAANSVTTEKLVADAVTAGKLAADSVQARNIVALAITTDKLAANSVTTAKLKVTEDMTVALLNVHKIQAGDIVAGAVTTDKIAANAVNSGQDRRQLGERIEDSVRSDNRRQIGGEQRDRGEDRGGQHHDGQGGGRPVPRLRLHRRDIPVQRSGEHWREAQFDRIANVGFQP